MIPQQMIVCGMVQCQEHDRTRIAANAAGRRAGVRTRRTRTAPRSAVAGPRPARPGEFCRVKSYTAP